GCGRICHSDDYNLALNFAGDLGRLGPHQYIHFAADAKLGQVNARLDRETGVGKNPPLIVNFQIVHVSAVGMDLGSDRVTSPVNEVIAKASLLDVISCGPVNFPSTNVASVGNAFLNRSHASVARVANHGEDFAHPVGRRFAYEPGPGNVVVDRPRSISLGPDIEQNKVAFMDSGGIFSPGFVMGIAAVGVDTDDGRIVSYQIF